ncbi:MAG: metal-dependent hydrolase [Chlamydiales bacterium]|nr:metal-dependent hydrolase [Chlamydiia bacterium]MCP5508723.1 metal-dependent hydrolase [Chlamydiales bacterium]
MNASLMSSLRLPFVLGSTRVSFPDNQYKGASKVIGVMKNDDNRCSLIFSETPFHPVDSNWPDQPADKGYVKLVGMDNKMYQVVDCQLLAVNKETQEVRTSKGISRNDRSNFHYVVSHVIDHKDTDPESFNNAEMEQFVDQPYRQNLSMHHTAAHLGALALNQAIKGYWKKEYKTLDSLGNPNFDQFTIESSQISPDNSTEIYRLGKSAKKILDVASVFHDLTSIQNTANSLLKEWINTNAVIEIQKDGDSIGDQRTWNCHLPQTTVQIPCGGTHLTNLSEFKTVEYTLTPVKIGNELKLQAVVTASRKALS